MKGTLSGRLHPTPVQQWKPSLFRLQGWDSSSSQGDWRESSRPCFSFVSFNIMPMLCWSTAILVLSVQLLSCVRLFATPWTAVRQASLSFSIPQSLLKLTPIESVTPSDHLLLCHPHLLLPSVFPRIRVFPSVRVSIRD